MVPTAGLFHAPLISSTSALAVFGYQLNRPIVFATRAPAGSVVSDFFDFSIYVHAEEEVIRGWFLASRNRSSRRRTRHSPRSGQNVLHRRNYGLDWEN